jgi:hypothetical protein
MQPLGIRIMIGVLLGILAALLIGALPRTESPQAMKLSSEYVPPLPPALRGSTLGQPVL